MLGKRERLDKLLLELGFFSSREKAQSAIMAALIKIDEQLVTKPGTLFNKQNFLKNYSTDKNFIQIADSLEKYVSRGAYKLQEAYTAWDLNFDQKTVLDIGASTGGFTDFCLQAGAKSVIAIDVGKGQLHYKLQKDPRVLNLEETNFKTFDPNQLDKVIKIDFVVIDVSFISLLTILKKLKSLMEASESKFYFSDSLLIIALLKPQFEAGKEIMDKCKGVIKDPQIREQVKTQSCTGIEELGFRIDATIESPITGAKGNIEYLLLLV